MVPTLKLLINGNPIEQVTNFNFLGITIDQNITWSDHITKISIKVARAKICIIWIAYKGILNIAILYLRDTN